MTNNKFTLEGIDTIIQNINMTFNEIIVNSLDAMLDVAILIRRDMEDTAPKIPIDYGNLRSSWFVVLSNGKIVDKASFKGEEAGKLSGDHSATISTVSAYLKQQKMPSMVMGFSAYYAMFVHENMEADFTRPKMVGGKPKKRRAGAGAKFFQAALERNQYKIIDIIAKGAKI